MRTKHITVYEFSELPSDKAKEKAREWLRSCFEPSDVTEAISGAIDDAAKILGIEIDRKRNSSEPSIGWGTNPIDGEYTGNWRAFRRPKQGFRAAIAVEFPQDATLHKIGEQLDDIATRDKESCAIITSGRYCGVAVEAQSMLDDATDSDAITDDLIEPLRDFAAWIGTLANAESEHLNSDESIDESMEANGYEFTEEGARE